MLKKMAILMVFALLLPQKGLPLLGDPTSLFSGGGYAVGLAAEVSVRQSRHEGFSRVVFEASDESIIKGVDITLSGNQIKVRFPSDLAIKSMGRPVIETSQEGRVFTIRPDGPFKIKVMRLKAPPRLSIDIIADDLRGAGAPLPSAKPPFVADQSRPPEKGKAETAAQVTIPNIRIVIDAGHGGYESGIVSGGLREKDITLSVARDLESVLTKKRLPVSLTRKTDQFLSITDRALSANQKSPDVFISIHLSFSNSFVIYTAMEGPAGIEPSVNDLYSLMSSHLHYIEKSRKLAEDLRKAIGGEFGTDVIQREMSLPLLNSVGAASVMIEMPKTIVYDRATRIRLSEAILRGIASYGNR